MDRLTGRTPKGDAYLANVKDDEQEVECRSRNTAQCIMDSWERLAAYEDTGLTPADIADLKNEWGGNYFDLSPTRCFLIWRKTNIPLEGFSMSPCEYAAWTSFNRNAGMCEAYSSGGNCLLCGKYHAAHLGSCDGCRWKKGME
jgi:hypothetical protein